VKIIGIVVEYNPFHNGHLYQIQSLRERFHPDGIVVVMSGHFVQRGQPAIFDKWLRTEMALAGGVDLVLELPVYYATASAEGFASGAVQALAATGIVTHLAFGTECDDLAALETIAQVLYEEPPLFKQRLAEHLKSGVSFAKARESALRDAFPQLTLSAVRSANAILAIEYLKACYRYNIHFVPLPIKRVGNAYNDSSIQGRFASATAIRRLLSTLPSVAQMAQVMPMSTVERIEAYGVERQMHMNAFEPFIRYRLSLLDVSEIAGIRDVGEGLEHKFKSVSNHFEDLSDFIMQVKSKRYAETRLNRILISLLMDIHSISSAPGYLRILGFNAIGQACLKEMKPKASRTIVTTLSKAPEAAMSDPHMKLDILATDLYHMASGHKKGGLDFIKPPVIFL
jgi:predicted nucleotidyltransferase